MATKKKSPAKKRPRPRPHPVVAPTDGHENICFTIMPYGRWPDYYYDEIYAPAIKAAGLIPLRADDFYQPSAIIHDIWVLTSQAKVILADLTGKNPNVFYELGLGHALAKPAILVADATETIPFDLRSLRIILYDKDQPDWGALLKKAIQTAITEVLNSTENAALPTFLVESQLRMLQQELAHAKRRGQKRARRSQHSAPGSATQTGGDTPPPAEAAPRMTRSEALAFARSFLDKKPLPPADFIRSLLEDKGFPRDQARSILEEACAKPLPPPPLFELEKEPG
ncbi:MAG TPA: hypothetical protein VF525_01270 [Pyrinomonadaceae bacterium]|jgi:hypothetical protein